MPGVEIRDGGLYKIINGFSGKAITFTSKDQEGVKIYTHLDINADGQQWLAQYTGNRYSAGNKFFSFKTMDKSTGSNYYLGYSSPNDDQPVIPRTTGDEWLCTSLGDGAIYMIWSVSDNWSKAILGLKNGVNADVEATLVLSEDTSNAVEWIFEELPLPA
ncbi:hypothetical protein H0H93_002278 [Arthromyces matolae]|nr:hypothetical protein H0H93_002278 [Arthromyces matolae]